MADTDAAQDLRMRVQVAWESSMDFFYEKLDGLYRGEIKEEDVIAAVARQIDPETADAYREWIDG